MIYFYSDGVENELSNNVKKGMYKGICLAVLSHCVVIEKGKINFNQIKVSTKGPAIGVKPFPLWGDDC